MSRDATPPPPCSGRPFTRRGGRRSPERGPCRLIRGERGADAFRAADLIISRFDARPHQNPSVNSPGFALNRAEWQDVLFKGGNRADLAACVPTWELRRLRVRVHRNHGFEAVSTATPAYAAWNGLGFDWLIGGYDDSLSFDLRGEADIDLVWLDVGRMQRLGEGGIGSWLVARISALRSQTANPILALAWPLSEEDLERFNRAAIPGTYAVDLAPLADSLGNRWLDTRAEAISGTRLSNRACLSVARKLACCWLPAVALAPRKAIAVDLDGTLYRGVLGEDGPSGVDLTSGHVALQLRLARFREAGILLALISRNELADVEDLFRQREDFPLRLTDFSAVEVSWNDKAHALRRLADTLRIGTDSIVLVDDNPGELAAVASSLPVVTVHARSDATDTVAALEHVSGLFRWRNSAEDRVRTEDLRASDERYTVLESSASPDDYLRSLQVRLDFLVGPRRYLARLAELCAKTNQFNLALGRMNEAEIARKVDDRPSNVVAIRLADRLSDSGTIGVLVGHRSEDALHVEELCISCRALGRRLEDSMLTKALLVMAGEAVPQRVVFALRKGPRNGPAREWLAQYAGVTLDDGAATLEMAFDAIMGKAISPVIRTEVAQ